MTNKEATNSELIDALNLCCDHIGSRLPEGYEVVITLCSDEASLSLRDPKGESVEIEPQTSISGLNSVISSAKEHQQEAFMKQHGLGPEDMVDDLRYPP